MEAAAEDESFAADSRDDHEVEYREVAPGMKRGNLEQMNGLESILKAPLSLQVRCTACSGFLDLTYTKRCSEWMGPFESMLSR